MPTPDDALFGRVAVQMGLVQQEKTDLGLHLLAQEEALGAPRRSLGDVLVERGFLEEPQLEVVREEIRRHGAIKTIGPYQLLDKLGGGGMGAVYKARALETGQEVALKVLPLQKAEDEANRQRFLREARVGMELRHPHIVRTLDAGDDQGVFYIVLEFVDGGDAAGLIKQLGTLGEREALAIARDVAWALQYAHEKGLIHRDIKPGNIMFDRAGHVKLSDFGLVKIGEGDSFRLTQTGMTVGTPHYISPEQAKGKEDLDTRADLYSLGATLYHLVTGTTPFVGATPAEVMSKHLTEELTPPDELNPALSDGCVAVIEKLLAKDRRDRYPNPGEAARDLERVLRGNEPAGAGIGGPARRKERLGRGPVRRRGSRPVRTAAVFAWLFAAATLAAGAALLVFFRDSGETDAQPIAHETPAETPAKSEPPAAVPTKSSEPPAPSPAPPKATPAPDDYGPPAGSRVLFASDFESGTINPWKKGCRVIAGGALSGSRYALEALTLPDDKYFASAALAGQWIVSESGSGTGGTLGTIGSNTWIALSFHPGPFSRFCLTVQSTNKPGSGGSNYSAYFYAPWKDSGWQRVCLPIVSLRNNEPTAPKQFHKLEMGDPVEALKLYGGKKWETGTLRIDDVCLFEAPAGWKGPAAPVAAVSEPASAPVQAPAASAWTTLFNGRDCTDWTAVAQNVQGAPRVEGGVLMLEGGAEIQRPIAAADFELRGRVKLVAGGGPWGHVGTIAVRRAGNLRTSPAICFHTDGDIELVEYSKRLGHSGAGAAAQTTWLPFTLRVWGGNLSLDLDGTQVGKVAISTRSSGNLALYAHNYNFMPKCRIGFKDLEMRELGADGKPKP